MLNNMKQCDKQSVLSVFSRVAIDTHSLTENGVSVEIGTLIISEIRRRWQAGRRISIMTIVT